MAASKLLCLWLAFFALATPIVATANAEVIGALTLDAAVKTAQLEKKASECAHLKQNRALENFRVDELASLKISRNESLTALSYLNVRNSYLCENDERIIAAFALGTLDAARKAYQIEDGDVQQALDTLYPSVGYHELAVQYTKLPEHVRNYFEQRVGTEPFNAGNTLRSFPNY